MADEPEFPAGASASVIADWVALFVCVMRQEMSRGRLIQVAEREGTGTNETTATDAWATLEQRSVLYGSGWPLQLNDDVLSPAREWDSIMAFYAFMCLLSIGDEIEFGLRRLFEHCVTDVVRGLTQGPSLRLGAPRVAPIPAHLDEAVEYYGEQANVITAKVTELGPHDQDVGLDVASWFMFEDGRGPNLHYIGQCATGRNWRDKTADLSVEVGGIMFSGQPDPVRFFAVPVVIRDPWPMRRVTQEAGLVLDRPRLLNLAASAPLSEQNDGALAEVFV